MAPTELLLRWITGNTSPILAGLDHFKVDYVDCEKSCDLHKYIHKYNINHCEYTSMCYHYDVSVHVECINIVIRGRWWQCGCYDRGNGEHRESPEHR